MHVKTRVGLTIAASGAAVGAMLVPASPAAAAAPSITATWATQSLGLLVQDGDTITVTGTGFPASTGVAVGECSTVTGGAADCDTDPTGGGIGLGQTDANGAFTATFVARTETLGSASCGAGDSCFVVATTDPTAPNPNTNTAATDLPFDRLQISPRTNLKTGQLVNVVGGNFKPNGAVYVSQCTSTDQAQAQQKCDLSGFTQYTADANGDFTDQFKVHTGVVGNDGSKCVAGGVCFVAGTDNILNPTAGNLGGAQIQFAPPVATSLTAKSTKASVAAGHKFAIKGVLKAAGAGLNGAKVILYKVTSSGLSKIASKTTATNAAGVKGAYKFGGLTQKKTSKYQVKFKGAVIAGLTYKASASKVVKVTT